VAYSVSSKGNCASISGDTKLNKMFQSEVEAVYIPSHLDTKPGTLCVSSQVCCVVVEHEIMLEQVGCSLSCSFCSTGAMDKTNLRNLKPEEIVGTEGVVVPV
jgi:adenine C2-methylase RlmN of 23S rRNA A2503 and tRNA A37